MNKARPGTKIKLINDVMSHVTGRPIKSGTVGVVLANRLPDAHGQPMPILVRFNRHKCPVSLTVDDVEFA